MHADQSAIRSRHQPRRAFFFFAFLSLLVTAKVLDREPIGTPRIWLNTPEVVQSGDSVCISARITNVSAESTVVVRWRVRDVPPYWNLIPTAGTLRGTSDPISLEVRLDRRGEFLFPALEIERTDLLNLLRSRVILKSDQTWLVAPRPLPLPKHEEFDFRARLGIDTFASLQQRFACDEYLGSREYLPGMAVRRWDYASWARLARPIVREYGAEGSPSVVLCLDLTSGPSSPKTGEPIESVEKVIALAANVGDWLLRAGFEIAAVATSDQFLPRDMRDPASTKTWLPRTLAKLPTHTRNRVSEIATRISGEVSRTQSALLIGERCSLECEELLAELERHFGWVERCVLDDIASRAGSNR